MSLKDDFLTLLEHSSDSTVTLRIRQLGEIQSFKNKKRGAIGRRKDGTTYPKTWIPDDVKDRMEKIIQSLLVQLRSVVPISDDGIMTEERRRALTALSVPLDDSRQWIKFIFIVAEDVQQGEEGADIHFYKLK